MKPTNEGKMKSPSEMSDAELEVAAGRVVAGLADTAVLDYLSGKKSALQFLVGACVHDLRLYDKALRDSVVKRLPPIIERAIRERKS